MATRISKAALMRAIIMEEMPNPHRLKKFTQTYLIPEFVLFTYLLVCLIIFDHDDDSAGEDLYHNASAWFLFVCLLPFMTLRIISLLCCNSLRHSWKQLFGIWFTNLMAYAGWSMYALVQMMEKGTDRTFSIDYFNVVLLLVLFCTSICAFICGVPLFLYKLYERATEDKQTLALKVSMIKLLPKVRYLENKHTSLKFCTICMSDFRNARDNITYLPCDARHFFHAKCVRSWLLTQNSVCPLCKVTVNFKKSIEHD